MIHTLQFLATLSTCMFAGAATYINIVEHPARMDCDTKTAATIWAPSYKRATVMQAPLAIVGFLSGLAVWIIGSNVMWLVGALSSGAVVPFTFIAIMPTNHQLLAPARDLSSDDTRRLLEKWGRLHGVRSALSLIASAIYVCVLMGT